jgi:hypothetical protein
VPRTPTDCLVWLGLIALLYAPAADGGTPEPADPETAEKETSGGQKPAWLEVELGFDVLHRQWRYEGLQPGAELREYSFPLFGAMRLQLGLFPVGTPEGLFRQLGLELAGAIALSPSLRGAGDETDYPSALYELDAAIRLRLRLGSGVVLGPVLGYRQSHARVQPSNSGATLSGIPTLEVGAIRAGTSLEGPIHGPVGFTLEAAYLWVLFAGELFQPPYFPEGSGGLSFDFTAGLSVAIGSELTVRLQGRFSQLGFTLHDPRASGATARSFGGGLSLQYAR